MEVKKMQLNPQTGLTLIERREDDKFHIVSLKELKKGEVFRYAGQKMYRALSDPYQDKGHWQIEVNEVISEI
jgi:hypothetical protein